MPNPDPKAEAIRLALVEDVPGYCYVVKLTDYGKNLEVEIYTKDGTRLRSLEDASGTFAREELAEMVRSIIPDGKSQ